MMKERIKSILPVAVLGLTMSLNAAIPAEVAPMLPENTPVVVHIDIAKMLKMPLMQRPEVKAAMEQSAQAAGLQVNDIKAFTVAVGSSDGVGVAFIETPLKADAFVKKALESMKDTSIKIESATVNGAKMIFVEADPTQFQRMANPMMPAMSGAKKEKIYVHQLKPSTLLVSDQKGMDWAMKANKKMTATSPLIKAIPVTNIANMSVWFAMLPTKEMQASMATPPEQAAMMPDFSKLTAAGGGFFTKDKNYNVQAKLDFVTDSEAAKVKTSVQMGMMMLGMAMQDQALVQDIQKAITVKSIKNACGISVKFDDALVERVMQGSMKMMMQQQQPGNFMIEETEIDEE